MNVFKRISGVFILFLDLSFYQITLQTHKVYLHTCLRDEIFLYLKDT